MALLQGTPDLLILRTLVSVWAGITSWQVDFSPEFLRG